MKSKPEPAVTFSAEEQDASCLEFLHDRVARAPGVVGVTLDTHKGQVEVSYDADQLSSRAVDHLVDDLAAPLRRHLNTCTLRIGRHGGRACASCALSLENRLKHTPGVKHASASFHSGILRVSFDDKETSADRIVERVRALGIRPAPDTAAPPRLSRERLELILTGITLVAMVAAWITGRTAAPDWVAPFLYALAYAAGGSLGVKASLESLRQHSIDIDLLMVLAALGAAFVGAPFEGAMLLFLFSLSNALQHLAMGRTRKAIEALMQLRPDQAVIRRGSDLLTLPLEEVVVDDLMVLRPGDRVPLDGTIEQGESAMDQASVTGESVPVTKRPGETVFAGTITKNGALEVRVTRTAQESTIARLIQMVEEAQSEKAETQQFIDKAEQYYAMGVIAGTILAVLVPYFLLGEGFQPAFYRAMTLMVAASPCALVISTPATILSAIGNAARRGVLFKGGAYVERAATIKVVAFDKTGTLTEGKLHVTDIVLLTGASQDGFRTEDELLVLAASVQAKSEHHLAQATVEAAAARNLVISEANAFEATAGKGVQGRVGEQNVRIGNLRHFQGFDTPGLDDARAEVERLQEEGKTCVVVATVPEGAHKAHLLGLLAFADVLREGVARVVQDLKAAGVERVVMLTGDNERVARQIASQAGLDGYYAEMLPEEKFKLLKDLEREVGPVAMVGDGINDAPALAVATLGIAMGAAGTDVAMETADVVLMADDLSNIPYVIALSRATRRTLITNLGFAFGMILVMIGTILFAGLPLPLAVIGHEGSTVLVSLNGLRMLAFRWPKQAAARPSNAP